MTRMTPVQFLRPQVAQELDASRPGWRDTGFVCHDDLSAARRAHVERMLTEERGGLTALDREVIDSIGQRVTLTSDTEVAFSEQLSFGERMADRMAVFGGSWTFILAFMGVLVVWIGFNASALFMAGRFDPYPFILLNLALSCIAALQAPLIMMSQRRQEAKDRLRAENDYRVNLKAELEIRRLHEKLDHLLIRQWERLAEIQQVQLEIMEEIARPGRSG